MAEFILVPNIVEHNGKTVRENNLFLGHKIPLGTLVEVNLEYNDQHKTRQFIASHGRDCDGTPLYSLTAKRNKCDDKLAVDEYGDPRDEVDYTLERCLYHDGGWSDNCLIVIEEHTDGGQS